MRIYPAFLSILVALLASFGSSPSALYAASPTPYPQWAVIGDAGHVNPMIAEARNSIRRAGISQLILPGDNAYEGTTYEPIWNPWKKLGFIFDLVAIGNHHLGYKNEITYFGMPGEFYTTVRSGVRFIVLNSDHVQSAPEQARFLDKTLAYSTEALNVVVLHHPFYTISKSHPWQEREGFHSKTRPVYNKYRNKISAFLLGHDHISSLLDLDGFPAIVAGAAAEQLPGASVNYSIGAAQVRTRWLYKGEPSWAKIVADSKSAQLLVQFVHSQTDLVLCEAVIQNFGHPGDQVRLGSRCFARSRHTRLSY